MNSKDKHIEEKARELTTLLSPFFSLFQQLSVATYERAACNGYISFSRNSKNKPKKPYSVVFFERKGFEEDNFRLLRKLLEGTSENRHLLVADANGDEGPAAYKVFGVGVLEEEDLICTVHFCGAFKWEVRARIQDAEQMFVPDGEGQYECQNEEADESAFFYKMERLFGFKPFKDKSGTYDVRKRWKDIYTGAAGNKHGTMLIVLEDKHAWYETVRLSDANRGFKVGKRVGTDRPLVNALTSIDGSLVYDFNGYIYGYGFILDGIAYVKGRTDKGARFNSALTYIATQRKNGEKALACIFSEDGGSITISTQDDLEEIEA